MIDSMPVPETARMAPVLTARERDVLRLLARGLSSKQIGRVLGLSRRTVDGHRARIMSKLGIRTLAGLVKYAIRARLASLDDDEDGWFPGGPPGPPPGGRRW